MSEHTPGPWVCHSGMVWKDGPAVWPKGDDNGIPIAQMHREAGNGTVPVERDANAHLIAAAPELLAACTATLAMLEAITSKEFSRGRDAPARAILRLAIANATNGQ